MTTRILLAGYGKMGGALQKGWSDSSHFVVSTLDPHNADADYQSAADITATYDVIVLAVKPQVMADVCATLRHLIHDGTLILSIAAGKTLAFFEGIFGKDKSIVRAMPNTPSLVNMGMTVLCGNPSTSEIQSQLAMNLMSVVGDVEWIDDETLMDAVTAVSGSGPAYVFHMIEAMAAAGTAAGLTPALAQKLARQTVIGAAALADSEHDTPASTLRENVTSPGGTTEAALKVLMSEQYGLTDLMTRAILMAKKRGQELA